VEGGNWWPMGKSDGKTCIGKEVSILNYFNTYGQLRDCFCLFVFFTRTRYDL
jgi:hypothetical protein